MGGTVFAVGDCNYGCIGNPPNWVMPPIPKISYPGEEQALHACNNVEIMDAHKGNKNAPMRPTWWPWGAGMFATSLGPHDACFVLAANHNKGPGGPAEGDHRVHEDQRVQERLHRHPDLALRPPHARAPLGRGPVDPLSLLCRAPRASRGPRSQ